MEWDSTAEAASSFLFSAIKKSTASKPCFQGFQKTQTNKQKNRNLGENERFTDRDIYAERERNREKEIERCEKKKTKRLELWGK